jgi:hypothetical protein
MTRLADSSLLWKPSFPSASVLYFGFPQTKKTFNSYLLRDEDPFGDGYSVFSPYIWNHVCIYYKKGGATRFALVRFQSIKNFSICVVM